MGFVMAKKSEKQVETISDLPPFPTLVWDTYFWKACVLLPSWKGFLSRGGAYGSSDSEAPSDGSVEMDVRHGLETGEGETPIPPFPEQGLGYQFLLDNDRAIRNQIVKAIFPYYAQLREQYKDDFDADEFEEMMPVLKKPGDLVQRMGLSIVHLLNIHHDGAAYIGFEIGCTWDEEHGVGVMTHQGRIVGVGQADTAFDEWVAKDDRKAMRKKTKGK